MSDEQWQPPTGDAGSSGPLGGTPVPPPTYHQPPVAPGATAPYGTPPAADGTPPAAYGTGQVWTPTFSLRPGIIPLRPLLLGDIYSGVMSAIRGNPAATMGLAFLTALVAVVPFTALGAWVTSFNVPIADATDLPETSPFGADPSLGLAGAFGSNMPALGTYVATPVVVALFSWVVSQAVLGRKVSAAATWAGARGRILPVLGGLFVVGFLTVVGYVAVLVLVFVVVMAGAAAGSSQSSAGSGLLAVLLGLLLVGGGLFGYGWLRTRLAFVPAVIVLENAGVRTALGRSWRLTSGRPFWRIFGIRLLTFIGTGILTLTISAVLTALTTRVLGLSTGPAFLVATTIVTGAVTVITAALVTPFGAGVDALLYVDQRIRREGLDVQLMQQVGAENR